jgi:hypothetical protein
MLNFYPENTVAVFYPTIAALYILILRFLHQ